MIKLSIIIVNYNSADLLEDCLNSLRYLSETESFEIIVYDNGDFEPQFENIKGLFPKAVYLEENNKISYAAANNKAAQKATGETLLFLNPDTIVKGKAVESLLNFLESKPECGAVGPRLINGNNVVEFSYAKDPSILSEFLLKYLRRLPSPLRHKIFRTDKTKEVDAITGAALMIRRKAFDEAGGFDEEYPLYLEDFDLCLKIRRKGWKIYFFHEAEIVHFLGATGEIGRTGRRKNGITEREVKYRIGQLRYYKKHRGKIHNLLLKLYLYFKFGREYPKFRV